MDKLSDLGINIVQERTTFDHDKRSHMNDDVAQLLHDAQDSFKESPNDEANFFCKLVEEGQGELYPRCKKHSNFPKTHKEILGLREP
ncbi:hypothetical protein Leryth_019329 [Lithospermum erythrorhizon]|nr:hypothetical protein Leryth_019329 [Lithospermum erythrorhizon]